MALYTPVRSVQAKAEYSRLPADRQGLVDRAISILAADPFSPGATVDEGHGARRAFVTPELTIRYGTHEHYLVVAEINDRGNSYLLGGPDV